MENPLEDIFGEFTKGSDDEKIYHCVECKYALVKIEGGPRKMFFCSNSKCEKYGMVTVVAINRNK